MAQETIKVLVVDDMEPIRRKFLRILGKHPGISASAASNGYEAVLLAARDRPDVILMDIEMETPLAGLSASTAIYKEDPEIKIIILTVHDEDSIIFKAFQSGIVDYLLKNSPEERVVQTVYGAYNNSASIQPEIATRLRREFKRIKDNEDSMIYILNIITQLTPTELDILKLLHAGFSQKEIASMRYIEQSTMKTHISHILKKFQKKSTAQVLSIIQEVGLFTLLR